MGTVIDLLLVAVLIILVIFGARKGFARTLFSFLAKIASVIIAYVVSDMYADVVYEKFFKESVVGALESNVDSTLASGDISMQISSVWENLPDFLKRIGEAFLIDPLAINGQIDDINLSGEIASSLEQVFAGPLATVVCRIVLFALVSFISSILLSVIVNLICKVVRLPVLRSADKLIGAALGLLNGLVSVFIISFVFTIVSGFITNEAFTEIVNSSYIINIFAYSGMLI